MLIGALLFLGIIGSGLSNPTEEGAAEPVETELFCDWLWEAKGRDAFPLTIEKPLCEWSLPSYLRKKLIERGEELKSWEIQTYRPWLLTWKEVKNFTDFKYWLGLNLPRKKAVLPNTKYWMFWNLGPKLKTLDFSKIEKNKLVLVMWEPPTVQKELYDPKVQACFGRIFTWDDELVDNLRFFKIHYPVLIPRIENIPNFEEKKFCVMICRQLKSRHPKELYSMRKKAIELFEEKPEGEFDLYGFHWEKKNYKNWKGALHSKKIDKLKEYKFSICYENMRDVKGYITEKIFDCFAAGVVPVYWGASNVTDYIPPSCFIDRRQFADDEAMYQFLKKMPKEEYQKYLDETAIFLLSEQAKVFTTEHFVENFLLHLYSSQIEAAQSKSM